MRVFICYYDNMKKKPKGQVSADSPFFDRRKHEKTPNCIHEG